MDAGKCSRVVCPDEVYAVRMSGRDFCRIFINYLYILTYPCCFVGERAMPVSRQGDGQGRQFRVFSCVLYLGANVFLMPNREL